MVVRKYLETLELNVVTRDYVRGLTEDPRLADPVYTYVRHVEQFSGWFVAAAVRLRFADLAETIAVRRVATELIEHARRERAAEG